VINDQVSSLSTGTDLATITIGGNDVGFSDVVITCTLGSYSSCESAVESARTYAENTLPALLDSTYAAIKSHAPNAEVVVLSYPLLFDTATSSCGVGGMSLAKRQIINAGDNELDDIIKTHAQSAGFTYGEARTTFAGHGICAATPWINSLQLTSLTDSFHPNKSGYTYGYLPALEAALS
jgi:lysophospholipase L1-like esterase